MKFTKGIFTISILVFGFIFFGIILIVFGACIMITLFHEPKSFWKVGGSIVLSGIMSLLFASGIIIFYFGLCAYLTLLKCLKEKGATTYDINGSCDINRIIEKYENILQILTNGKYEPVSFCAKHEAVEAYDHLRCHYFLSEAEELVKLLAKPHMKSLLVCHDIISNKQYEPILPEVPYEVDEDDVMVKIVHIVKDNEPLGATIKVNERTGAVLIARVMHGGAADRCGALSVGDEIQEINRLSVQGRDPMEVIKILTSITGDVKLKVCTSMSSKSANDQNMCHVRALFSYSPALDQLIPCREAGIAFRKGDILRLVNTEDPNWWQAVKVDPVFGPGFKAMSLIGSNLESESLPGIMAGRTGLIPSRTLQEKKEQYKMAANQRPSGWLNYCFPVHISQDILLDSLPEILTYEDVDQYFAEDCNYRPIVIIGPPGVGKSELKRELINTDLSHFKEPIKITTREPAPNEEHGQDYLFVTLEEFETFARADSLINYWSDGEFDKTGLCVDAVLEIIQCGMVPVFTAKPQSIPALRTAALKPFIIYIRPPSIDILLETRPMLSAGNKETKKVFGKSDEIKYFKESDFEEMIQIGSRMELLYAQYFDHIIVNDDLPVALEQLSEMAYRLETEPFWVPKRWLEQESSTASSVTTDTKE